MLGNPEETVLLNTCMHLTIAPKSSSADNIRWLAMTVLDPVQYLEKMNR